MDIVEVFGPLLDAGLARLQKFNNPEPCDLINIFGPTFTSACLLARKHPAVATARILGWNPADLTADSLRAALRELTTHTGEGARQAVLEVDMGGSDDPNVDLMLMSRATLDTVIGAGWYRSTPASVKRAKAGEDERERRDAILENRPYEPRVSQTPCFLYP